MTRSADPWQLEDDSRKFSFKRPEAEFPYILFDAGQAMWSRSTITDISGLVKPLQVVRPAGAGHETLWVLLLCTLIRHWSQPGLGGNSHAAPGKERRHRSYQLECGAGI